MAGSGSAVATEPAKKEIVVVLAADQKWGPMDPSNDKMPMAAPLWGDMTKEANGWLIKVKPGSPGGWHTHSGGYHGVVIAGSPNHLQPGDKKPTPLPPGSYWFEPGGVPHNSQCLGKEECIALVHFNDGKADFAPAEEDKKGKRDPKYVEKVVKDIKWVALMPDMKDKGPMIADVWGDSASGTHGRHWKFPAGFASPAHTHATDYHGVVIKGTVLNHAPGDAAPKEMGPGSYWMQPAGVSHVTACKAGSECIAYTYNLGKFDFMTDEAAGAGGGGGGSAGSAAAGSAAAGSGSAK
jgi:quercetin dioxygenase-like cupin family protein